MRCMCHHHAVTNLRCSRCETPICPDCSVVGPVGMLCRTCGNPRHSPLYKVEATSLAKAYAACLGLGLLYGAVALPLFAHFGFIGLWIGFLYGGGLAEVGLRVAGRKRGLAMEIMAGICAGGGALAGLFLLSLITTPSLIGLMFSPFVWINIIVATVAAVLRLRNF